MKVRCDSSQLGWVGWVATCLELGRLSGGKLGMYIHVVNSL